MLRPFCLVRLVRAMHLSTVWTTGINPLVKIGEKCRYLVLPSAGFTVSSKRSPATMVTGVSVTEPFFSTLTT